MRILKDFPYKGTNGIWLTEALFFDRMTVKPTDQWPVQPLFTFFEKRPDYRCAMDDFVALEDPTGYLWAMKYLGDWNHWLRLMRTPWFPEVVEEWRRTLAIKQQAEALATIRDLSRGSSPQALMAAKYLAEEGWKPKATKGRPSKEMVDKELKQLTKAQQESNADAARIGLKVINGGN